MTLGCPQCGTLDYEKHQPGCTWDHDHPNIGGIDHRGYYVIATYVGTDMPDYKGKIAKVHRSRVRAHGNTWAEIMFIEEITVDDISREYLATFDMRYRRPVFLLPARDFDPVIGPERDPILLINEMTGGCQKFVDEHDWYECPKCQSRWFGAPQLCRLRELRYDADDRKPVYRPPLYLIAIGLGIWILFFATLRAWGVL